MKKHSKVMSYCYLALAFPVLALLLILYAFHVSSHPDSSALLLRHLLVGCFFCTVAVESLLLVLRDYLAEITVKAYTDITGVQDKKALERCLRQLRERSNTLDVGIMMFDLNGLKQINDQYGHDKGDVCIQVFAGFLTRILSSNSFLARFGGDEFVIIQEHCTPDELAEMNSRLEQMIRQYNSTAVLPISYAVGYDVSYQNHYYLVDDLMKIADQKMYRDKAVKKRQDLDAMARSVRDEISSVPTISTAALSAQLKALQSASAGRTYLLLMEDIDDFHLINDAYGYEAGNRALSTLYKALCSMNRSAMIFRFHADIFVTILDVKDGSLQETLDDLSKQRVCICQKLVSDLHLGRCTVSTGIFPLSDGSIAPEDAIAHANLARQMAKHRSNHLCCYSQEIAQQEQMQAEVLHSFQQALEQEEFQLYFQPKVSGSTGQIDSAEVLVRWQRKDGTLWMPDFFIPLLEKTGDVIALDFYVYEHAFQWMHRQNQQGRHPISLAMNLSPVHFSHPETLVSTILSLIGRYQVDPAYLIFEITETAYIEHPESVNEIIRSFHEHHIRISMDDFGSGYSSLNALKDILFDEVKLDRKFVQDGLSPTGQIVMQEMFHLLKRMNKSIVCEGVETEEVARFLIQEGCDELQGFLYYQPVCAETFSSLLLESA